MMSKALLTHPFDPIVFGDTRLLILGSFPSRESFEKNFYYAHPSNQFWSILSGLTGYPVLNRDQKIWLLKQHHLGLWDMIHTCHTANSLDRSIEDEQTNDIPRLLERYPSIRKLAFTGRKAQAIFETHFGDLQIERCYLPSPSSAYASMRLDQKIVAYGDVLHLEKKP
jgi:TDG/mug DNA glycosylase family protein